jgi:hypothetical protein
MLETIIKVHHLARQILQKKLCLRFKQDNNISTSGIRFGRMGYTTRVFYSEDDFSKSIIPQCTQLAIGGSFREQLLPINGEVL